MKIKIENGIWDWDWKMGMGMRDWVDKRGGGWYNCGIDKKGAIKNE